MHLLSRKFTVNGAWLVLATIALSLSRAIGTLAGTDLGKAPSGTIRRNSSPLPPGSPPGGGKSPLDLPAHWPWETIWSQLRSAGHQGMPHSDLPNRLGATKTTERHR